MSNSIATADLLASYPENFTEWDPQSSGRPSKTLRAKFAATCLASGVPPFAVVSQLQRCFKVSQRSAWRDLAEARKLLRLWNGGSVEDLRHESAAFYRSILTSPQASIGEKIKARAQLDKLLGLHLPAQTAEEIAEAERRARDQSDGNHRQHFNAALKSMSVEQLEAIADFQAKVRELAAADEAASKSR